MEKLNLKEIDSYRDGGSLKLEDENGKKFFQDNSLRVRNNLDTKGLVYSGNINDKPWPEPVKGFEIYIKRNNGEVVVATNKE